MPLVALFIFAPTEDLFKRFNPGFPIFDLQFNENFDVDDASVPEALLKFDDGEYLSFEDLPSRAKAEALIAIIVASCLNLVASPYKNIIQDVFGRLVFHARTSLCRFVVNRKGKPSELTHEAASYLHGRHLSNLMGVPEEAFVRFVIITDFLRYHFDAIGNFSRKYRHLLCEADYSNLISVREDYNGEKALTKKAEKGFRKEDITFFQEMKLTVSAERDHTEIVPSKDEHYEKQFVFNYPCSSNKVKVEGNLNRGKSLKRKPNTLPEALSMPLEEGSFVDYKGSLIMTYRA